MRKSQYSLVTLVTLGGLLLASPAFADIVTLQNGKRIEGKILERDSERLLVEVEGLRVTIFLKDVAQVSEGETLTEPGDTDAEVPSLAEPALGVGMDTAEEAAPAIESPGHNLPFLPMLPVILPPGRSYEVEGSSLRLREGPGTDYEVVENLRHGSLVSEIEKSSGWLHVRVPSGAVGWVASDYVKLLDNTPVLVNANRLNLREEPGRVYRSLTRLRKGEVGLLLADNSAWSRVQFGMNRIGWCSSEYLVKIEDIAVVRPPLVPREASANPYVVLKLTPSSETGKSELTFEVTDDTLVEAGLTKIVAFVDDLALLEEPKIHWTGDSVLGVEILQNRERLNGTGFHPSLYAQAKGAAVLRVKGFRERPIWRYTLTGPQRGVRYAIVTQSGPKRGRVVLCKP